MMARVRNALSGAVAENAQKNAIGSSGTSPLGSGPAEFIRGR